MLVVRGSDTGVERGMFLKKKSILEMFADLYRNVKAVKEEHLSFAFHVSFIRHSEPLTFVTVTAANIWDSSIPSTFKFQIPADASVAVFLETTGHDREGLWSTGRPLAMNSG